MAIVQCHMIITCKPHGMNLIGATEFRNKPQKALDVYQTLSLLEGGVWGQDYQNSGVATVAMDTPTEYGEFTKSAILTHPLLLD